MAGVKMYYVKQLTGRDHAGMAVAGTERERRHRCGTLKAVPCKTLTPTSEAVATPDKRICHSNKIHTERKRTRTVSVAGASYRYGKVTVLYFEWFYPDMVG